MSKTERKRPQSHRSKHPELRIVIDTSAVFTKVGHFLLSTEVSELIKRTTGYSDLVVKWYLPTVVRHERQYQILSKSMELLPAILKLEALLGHNLNITQAIIEERVQRSVDQQISDLKLEILDVDTKAVDWENMILDATYRKAPFSSGENEKGFRDALIAEAFLQLILASPTTTKACLIALLAHDSLLADAVASRTVGAKNVRILRSVEEVKDLINVLVSEADEEFVESVREAASEYFFTPRDDGKGCLYYKGNVWDGLCQKFDQEINSMPSGADERERERTLIDGSRFVKKERQRIYWANRVIVKVKAYRYSHGIPGLVGGGSIFGSVSASGLYEYNPLSSGFQLVGQPPLGGMLTGLNAAEPILASREKSLFKTGEIVFEVVWSVTISAAKKKFGAPNIESVEHVSTSWS